ncbi:hypothetical protein [Pedobacter alluvionis]|uniref:hypothetical protein n=1 Tax=Pedobacter alluvionis TaxID=475253 RepID=UPI001ABCCA62
MDAAPSSFAMPTMMSGGANSYWNLLLYLVEKLTDRDTAILAAKYFAIDINRESQLAFMMFHGLKGCFQEITGLTPIEYRNKYHKAVPVCRFNCTYRKNKKI